MLFMYHPEKPPAERAETQLCLRGEIGASALNLGYVALRVDSEEADPRKDHIVQEHNTHRLVKEKTRKARKPLSRPHAEPQVTAS